VAMLSERFSRGEEHMVATVKFLAALAIYPITWIVFAVAIGLASNPVWGVAALVVLPFLGYIALRAIEEIDRVIGDLRAIAHRLFKKHGHARLLEQLETIRKEMRGVAREMG
jgi:hypothetical protein